MSRITLFGGVKEIGGNKVLLEDGETRVFLDFGMSFSRVQHYYDEFLQPRANSAIRDMITLSVLPRIDGIYRKDWLNPSGIDEALQDLPGDFKNFFLWDLVSGEEYAERYGAPYAQALFVSHCHADHVNHLAYLDPRIPVFCSFTTLVMLMAINEVGRSTFQSEIYTYKTKVVSKCGAKSTFPGSWTLGGTEEMARTFQVLREYERIAFGNLHITGVPVDHSVPGAMAFYIETSDDKRILYTGDLRFHGRFEEHSKNLRRFVSTHRVDYVMSEGTRIQNTKEDQDNEAGLADDISQILRDTRELAVVDFGWKDTTRYDTLREVAKMTGRVFVISPKLAYLLEKLRRYNPELFPGVPKDGTVKVYLKRGESMLYSPADYTGQKFKVGYATEWDTKQVGREYAENDTPVLHALMPHYYEGVRAYDVRKQQGRYILHMGFFDMNEFLDIAPNEGSVFIKASVMPFNEEMQLDEKKLEHWLKRFKFKKFDEESEEKSGAYHYAHTSGHACGEDIFEFIKEAKAGAVIPMHTQYPDKFKDSGRETILCTEGEPVDLD